MRLRLKHREGVFKKFRLRLLPPKVDLMLNLEKLSFALGEDVRGILRVVSHEDFECDEVRCELKCVESVLIKKTSYDEEAEEWIEEEEWESSVIHSAKPRLAGPLRLARGDVREYPFSIPYPPQLLHRSGEPIGSLRGALKAS